MSSPVYSCRCGALVHWLATPDGLSVLDEDGQPHRRRCPLRDRPVLTPRDRHYLDNRPVSAPQPTLVVKTDPSVDRAAMNRILDVLAELPLAVDEIRVLGQSVARYAAQVDRRQASRPRPPAEIPPPATTTGEPKRGASVVRTPPRQGAD